MTCHGPGGQSNQQSHSAAVMHILHFLDPSLSAAAMLKRCLPVKMWGAQIQTLARAAAQQGPAHFLLLRNAEQAEAHSRVVVLCYASKRNGGTTAATPRDAEPTDHVKHLTSNSPMKMEGA